MQFGVKKDPTLQLTQVFLLCYSKIIYDLTPQIRQGFQPLKKKSWKPGKWKEKFRPGKIMEYSGVPCSDIGKKLRYQTFLPLDSDIRIILRSPCCKSLGHRHPSKVPFQQMDQTYVYFSPHINGKPIRICCGPSKWSKCHGYIENFSNNYNRYRTDGKRVDINYLCCE